MHPSQQQHIQIAGTSLIFQDFMVDKDKMAGIEIASLAGIHPASSAVILAFLPNGELEDIRPDEEIKLNETRRKFIAADSDRSYKATINTARIDWPCRGITGGQIRKLGNIPRDHEVLLTRIDQPDKHVADHELVDLDKPGIEAFISRKPAWKLKVQSVDLIYYVPEVVARQAIQDAGINPEGWLITLKVRGQPPRSIELDDVVDLRTEGIEKLRLVEKDIHNGEAPSALLRDFALLDADVAHLNAMGLAWETFAEGGNRWLLIHDYPLPDGYTPKVSALALVIPSSYPQAEIDMFHFFPPALLESGRDIDRTQVRQTIRGKVYHGWSRHRGPATAWNPASDNVAAHLVLVESSLLKELGE